MKNNNVTQPLAIHRFLAVRKLIEILASAVLMVLFLGAPVLAQDPMPILASGINQRGRGGRFSPGIRAGGAAMLMGSQSFTYSAPMFPLPGRHGLNLSLGLVYNSLIWQSDLATNGVTFNSDAAFQPNGGTPAIGFRLDFGTLMWYSTEGVTSSGVLIDSSGAKHELVNSGNSTLFNSTDSTYISVQHHASTGSSDPETDIATYKNGMQVFYQFAVANALGNITVTQPVKIEDASGNFITINYSGGNQFTPPALASVVDTVGRTISFIYNNGLLSCVTDGTSCTPSGSSRVFSFTYNTSYVLNYNFAQVLSNSWSAVAPLQGSKYPYTVLSSVTRPDGTQVKFNYGDWLMVNDIQELSSNGTLRYETNYNFPAAGAGQLSSPPAYSQQTATTFDKDGNKVQAAWQYQAIVSSPAAGEKFVSCFAVTDPVGTIHMTTFSTKGDVFDGLPIQRVTATGSSAPCTSAPTTILTTVNTQWISDTNSSGTSTGANPRVQSTTSVLSDGTTQSQTKIVSYDAHGNPTDVQQFDFGSSQPGPLLREVVAAYATNLGNIVNRPADVQAKDGGGNLLFHEIFTYDNYGATPLQSFSPLPPGFDSANFGGTTAPPRGNLTGATVYTNAAAGTGAINSTFTYDIFGNRLTSQSGCCTQGAAAFSAATEYAYPDSTSVGPSGNQFTTKFTYHLNNGLVATSTDANGEETQFNFDVDNRPENTTTPDNVTVSYSYDDAAENPGGSVSTSANSAVEKKTADFLGRSLLHEVLNGTSIVSTTAYINDALGRPIQISNPYGPSDSAVYTNYAYDALGRTESITPPAISTAGQNSSQIQYTPTTFTDASGKSHSGVSVQSTDAAGKPRLYFTDALGRLVRVDEPNGSSLGTSSTASVTVSGAIGGAPNSGATPPLAAPGTPLTSFNFSDGSSHAFYLSANQHIWHLLWNGSINWDNQDLTAITGNTPAAANSQLSAVIESSGNTHVFYLDSSQHVHQLFCCSWQDMDLTALSGGVLAASGSALTSEVLASGNPVHVYYLGPNRHVYHLFIDGTTGGWHNQDLTGQIGGPLAAAGSSLANVLDLNGQTHVFYLDTNQHINQLWCCSGAQGWNNQDLTAITGNTLAASGTALTGEAATATNRNPVHLYYLGSNQHLYHLFIDFTTGDWNNQDLTAASNGHTPAAGSALTNVPDSTPSSRVFFLDGQQHLNLTGCAPGSCWVSTDLSASVSSNVVAGSALTGFGLSASNPVHVHYEGANQHIYHYFQDSSGAWHNQDLTGTTPVSEGDSGTVSLGVGGFTATACFGASTNPACSGQKENVTASDVASALAQALNGANSPVTATLSSATLNMTWKEAGPFTAPVGALTTAHDNSSLFPNPSFTSAGANFSGGSGPSLSSPNSTYYSYDAMGHLLQVTQGQQTRTYQYDSLGRVTSSVMPETGYQTATAGYTDFGTLSQVVEPRVLPGTTTHVTTTFSYDALNRLQTVTYNDGTPAITYKYNAPGASNNTGGRVANVTNGVSSETYQYDVMGRTKVSSKVIGGQTYAIDYNYNADGTLASMTYPSGRTVATDEDAIGRLADIKTNGRSLLTINSYSAAGQVLGQTYGNGIVGTYSYNNQLQVASVEDANSSQVILNLSYNYGGMEDNGQILGVTDGVDATRTTSYAYDALGRLLTAQTNNLTSPNSWQLQFAYDRYGNRLSETPAGGKSTMPSSSLTIDPTTNHITQQGFGYDAAGNMTSDSQFSYSFNAAGQMTAVNPLNGGSPIATYSYDAKSLRVVKNGTVYIYSGRKVLAEYPSGTAAASPTVEHIYRGNLRLASIASGAVTYHYADNQSVRVDTDSNGNVTRSYGHFPFGETWYETGTTDTWKFTNYENDAESGLDYALNRFYSSTYGRFQSPDLLDGNPGDPQAWNHYAYVGNDPLNKSDPSGLHYLAAPENTGCAAGPLYGCATWGDDIFDALDGAPGTYISIDMFGNVGFGWDYGLYTTTMNFVDNARENPPTPECQADPDDPACHPDNVPTFNPGGAFQVVVQDFGNGPDVQGFIPDLIALQQQQALVVDQLGHISLAGTQFAGAGNLLNLFLSNSPAAWGSIVDWAQENLPQASSALSAFLSLQQEESAFLERTAGLFGGSF